MHSMTLQLSQSPLDKRPEYDAIQGANVTPTTFYNIGDLEIQDNLARIWYRSLGLPLSRSHFIHYVKFLIHLNLQFYVLQD